MNSKLNFDVVVVGGGLAGVMSAVSASRQGARVLLCERYGFLGGMATSALVNPFMPYFENGEQGKIANAGLFAQMRSQLHKIGGVKEATSRESQPFNNELLKIVLDRMCASNNVTVLLHSLLSDVSIKNGKIDHIVLSTISGNIAVYGKAFVDATGNADLCAFANLGFELGREEDGLCQPMTLCFRVCNVDWHRYNRHAANKIYRAFREEGKISNPREDVLAFEMPNFPHDGIMHLNTTRVVGLNATNVWERSKAEREAREQVLEMFEFLRGNVEGLERIELVNVAAETGIRESRRIVGYYRLSSNDIVNAVKLSDSIARGTYEIDIHNPSGTGTFHKRIPNNNYYTIPYRCLVPQESDNLVVAGRPISCSHEAHASIRIMPITSCIGEAVGIAAWQMCSSGCRAIDVNVQELQGILQQNGGLF